MNKIVMKMLEKIENVDECTCKIYIETDIENKEPEPKLGSRNNWNCLRLRCWFFIRFV